MELSSSGKHKYCLKLLINDEKFIFSSHMKIYVQYMQMYMCLFVQN